MRRRTSTAPLRMQPPPPLLLLCGPLTMICAFARIDVGHLGQHLLLQELVHVASELVVHLNLMTQAVGRVRLECRGGGGRCRCRLLLGRHRRPRVCVCVSSESGACAESSVGERLEARERAAVAARKCVFGKRVYRKHARDSKFFSSVRSANSKSSTEYLTSMATQPQCVEIL